MRRLEASNDGKWRYTAPSEIDAIAKRGWQSKARCPGGVAEIHVKRQAAAVPSHSHAGSVLRRTKRRGNQAPKVNTTEPTKQQRLRHGPGDAAGSWRPRTKAAIKQHRLWRHQTAQTSSTAHLAA
mmetsp:Transcript_70403/g.204159  ORF Transcript_70403/g.204159 Transcript_70403/m.204159 type:complete len:125 (-) Transcript_70403:18-392(-)